MAKVVVFSDFSQKMNVAILNDVILSPSFMGKDNETIYNMAFA